jgi:hypothetical protein
MCCLGFVGLACGQEEKSLLGINSPVHTMDLAMWPEGFIDDCDYENDEDEDDDEDKDYAPYCDSDLVEKAMRVNDNPDITDSEREQRLTEILSKLGVELEFVEMR